LAVESGVHPALAYKLIPITTRRRAGALTSANPASAMALAAADVFARVS